MSLVTIAESGFFPHLYALKSSIDRVGWQVSLTVVCVDDELARMVNDADWSNVVAVPPSEYMTPNLAEVKRTRSIGEFCWTLTGPTLMLASAMSGRSDWTAYVDTDVWFARYPKRTMEEFTQSAADVMITPHGFAPDYDSTERAGRYVVQFLPVRRGAVDDILATWSANCLADCSVDSTVGQLGDQKYLEDWPSLYGDRVHVLSDPGLIQGPWNMTRYPYSEAEAFHFHALRWKGGRRFWIGANRIPQPTIRHAYDPYLREVLRGIEVSRMLGVEPRVFGRQVEVVKGLGISASRLRRALWNLNPNRTLSAR